MAHTRQSRPDFGVGFQFKVLERFQVVPTSPGNGRENLYRGEDAPVQCSFRVATQWAARVSFLPEFVWYVTKFNPHTSLKLIT